MSTRSPSHHDFLHQATPRTLTSSSSSSYKNASLAGLKVRPLPASSPLTPSPGLNLNPTPFPSPFEAHPASTPFISAVPGATFQEQDAVNDPKNINPLGSPQSARHSAHVHAQLRRIDDEDESTVHETQRSELFTGPQQSSTSLKERRIHRRAAQSVDIPRQTLMKALVSRPPISINTMNGLWEKPGSHHPQQRRLSEALASLQLDPDTLTATKVAALTSPCFFHKKFDNAINIDKVLEEIKDDAFSHSRLMQTATGVREVSKQLQRRPIKMTFKNIMIITKARDNELVHLTRELAEWLLTTPRYGSEVGVNVYVDAKLKRSKRFDEPSLLAKDDRFKNMLRHWTPDLCWSSPEKFDLVITLGGDGTVLFTSWLFQRIVPPILSFSLGSLGFLTNFQFQSFKEQLNTVMGDAGMRVNLRMRFTCTVYRAVPNTASNTDPDRPTHVEGEQYEVLNELVIDRGPSPYVSQLELFGDDHLLTVVQADGCIFSTPTGSTAYSLSAGGSLVHPDIPAILLTPICPHTLSFRPMLLNDTMLLKVAVPSNSRATAYCSFDGKGRVELRPGDHVTIAASQYPFPTVLSQPTEWFDSISRTLRWNTRGAQQKGWEAGEGSLSGKFDDEESDPKAPEFDIDIDDDMDRDSGYSAASSSAGAETPLRRNTGLGF